MPEPVQSWSRAALGARCALNDAVERDRSPSRLPVIVGSERLDCNHEIADFKR